MTPNPYSLYSDLLQLGLIRLRNLLESSGSDERLVAARCLANLLHYVPPLLRNPTTGKGDVYFVSVGCREFLARYPLRRETPFVQLAVVVDDLIASLGISEERSKIVPKDVADAIVEYRQRNQ